MLDKNEALLHVVSSRKVLGWRAFKDAFEYLYLRDQNIEDLNENEAPSWAVNKTVRALDILGHCELAFSQRGNHVHAAPPVLARLPIAGLPQAVLTGSRSPVTLSKVEEACPRNCEFEVQQQRGNTSLVPARILVHADVPEVLEEMASQLNIHYENVPPAWKLLDYAGSLDQYLTTRPAPASGELVGWPDRSDFHPRFLQFKKAHLGNLDVRLSRYTHPTTSISHFFIWKDGKRVEVDRDWGRYIALHAAGVDVLVYDRRRFIFAVPASASLPRLLARSLCLCSGYTPYFVPVDQLNLPTPETWGYRLFRWIPPQIAGAVASRLNQNLISREIDFDF